MAKISKPILYTLILGAGALIYVYATDPAPVAAGPARRIVKTTKAKVDVYEPEDYKAKFAVLNEPARNAFKPLVISHNAILQTTPPDPSHLPATLTGGEAGWAFTGYVEVNGSDMALVENDSTGEGVYLKRGDKWKGSLVSSVSDETLVLVGPDRAAINVKLGDRGETTNANTVAVNPTPVQPPLQGVPGAVPGTAPAIAGNVPGDGSMMTGAIPLPGVDFANQPNQDGGRRRWRGR